MNVILYILIIIVFVMTILILRHNKILWKRYYSPYFAIGFCSLLYTSPALFEMSVDYIASEFLVLQLVSMAGLSLGTLLADRHISKVASYWINIKYNLLNKYVGSFALLFFIFFIVCIDYFYGGIGNVLVSGYKSVLEADQVDNYDANPFVAFIAHGMPQIFLFLALSSKRKSVLFVAVLYITLLLIMGTRNTAMMFVGSFVIFSSLRYRRMNYTLLIAPLFILYFLLVLVAFYRSFGFNNIEQFVDLVVTHGFSLFRIENTEFGTSYNVFKINELNRNWWDGVPGESYFRILLSLVPKYLWADRPLSIAGEFSSKLADQSEGLGFSTNLEAYISAGLFGVFIFNLLIGYLWQKILINVARGHGFYVFLYSTFIFFSLNINRIDTQVVFKITLIRVIASAAIFYFLFVFSKNESDVCRSDV